MTEPTPTYRIPQGAARTNTNAAIQSLYRSSLSQTIALERLMVDMGIMKPEERRVFGRQEKRAELTNGRCMV